MVAAVDPTTVMRTSPSGAPLARSVTRPVTLPPCANAVEAAARLNNTAHAELRTRKPTWILIGPSPGLEAEKHPTRSRGDVNGSPRNGRGPDDYVTRPAVP